MKGTIGNAFYIITEGSCKVTLNTDRWKEKEVNRMNAGDFFGKSFSTTFDDSSHTGCHAGLLSNNQLKIKHYSA